jgi:predicted glycosyltransferase
MKSIIFDDDDDEVQPMFVKFAHPFCDSLLSPDAIPSRKNKKTIFYSGYHDLAYLHPNWFTPDKSVLSRAGIAENTSYFILRFTAFKAHHDTGEAGLTIEQKHELVRTLSPFGRVFITNGR